MEEKPIEVFKLKNGNTLKIFPDPDPTDPREWDNLGKLICFHRRYRLGDKTDLHYGMFSSWADLRRHLVKNGARVILPVFMIDHSGISIRTRDFSDCDPGEWDSGQIGFIYATNEIIRREMNVKRITKKTREKIAGIPNGEISTYNDYLTGNVYGFEVVNESGDIEDSCWGFIGDYQDTILQEYAGEILK